MTQVMDNLVSKGQFRENTIPFSKQNLKYLEVELGFILNTKVVGFLLAFYPYKE